MEAQYPKRLTFDLLQKYFTEKKISATEYDYRYVFLKFVSICPDKQNISRIKINFFLKKNGMSTIDSDAGFNRVKNYEQLNKIKFPIKEIIKAVLSAYKIEIQEPIKEENKEDTYNIFKKGNKPTKVQVQLSFLIKKVEEDTEAIQKAKENAEKETQKKAEIESSVVDPTNPLASSTYNGWYLATYISTHRGMNALEQRLYRFEGNKVMIYSDLGDNETYSKEGTLSNLAQEKSTIMLRIFKEKKYQDIHRLRIMLSTIFKTERTTEGQEVKYLLGSFINLPKRVSVHSVGRVCFRKLEDSEAPNTDDHDKLLQSKFQKRLSFNSKECKELFENEPHIIDFFVGTIEKDHLGSRLGVSYHLFDKFASENAWFYNLLQRNKIRNSPDVKAKYYGTNWYGYYPHTVYDDDKKVKKFGVMKVPLSISEQGEVTVRNYISETEKENETYYGIFRKKSGGHLQFDLKRKESTSIDLNILVHEKMEQQLWGQLLINQSGSHDIYSEFLIMTTTFESLAPTSSFIERWSPEWDKLSTSIRKFLSLREFTIISTPVQNDGGRRRYILEKNYGYNISLVIPAQFTKKEAVSNQVIDYTQNFKAFLQNTMELKRVYSIFDDYKSIDWKKVDYSRFNKIMIEIEKSEKIAVIYPEILSKIELLDGHSSVDIIIGIAIQKKIPLIIFRHKSVEMPKLLLDFASGQDSTVQIKEYNNDSDLENIISTNPALVDIRK